MNSYNDDYTLIVSPISTYERVNGDETDIDYQGNGCDRCTLGEEYDPHEDCDEGYCIGNISHIPTTCAA